MRNAEKKDLIVLVADGAMEQAMRGILSRYRALGASRFSFDIIGHPEKDPGCRRKADALLRSFSSLYAHALVMFDREGCGKEDEPRESLEIAVQHRLSRAGWGDRAQVIVLDPELEIWVWSDSPHVEAALGWADQELRLRKWMRQKGFLRREETKPHRPKEAYEEAIRTVGKSKSRRVFRQLAERVSLKRCQDPAFLKLRDVLRRWFPPAGS